MYRFGLLRPHESYMRPWNNNHSDNALVWPAPSHYLNQCWNIVNWTVGNNLQWNLYRKLYIFIKKKCFWKYRQEVRGHFVSASMCFKLNHIEWFFFVIVIAISLHNEIQNTDRWRERNYIHSEHEIRLRTNNPLLVDGTMSQQLIDFILIEL